jgi:hypothetical protein
LIILVEAQLHDKVNLGNVKKTFKWMWILT